jgi:serine/threonine-protein kinase
LPRRHVLRILPAEVSADPEYRERFNRESDLASTLWHPHVVGLYDRGEFDGRLWLSSDYVDGTDSARLLSRTHPDGMPPDEAVEIVTAIADALDHAHDHGLLHRYVKPGNILLTQPLSGKRRILLADFGVPRQTDMAVHTVNYTAPEQLMGDSIDGRADQYALACTAFHLLTGSPPFVNNNPAVVISKHLNETPPRPSDVRPELAPFDEPFSRALAKEPTDRFERCQDFAEALSQNQGDQGATAVLGWPAPSPQPPHAVAPEPEPEPEPGPEPDAETEAMAPIEPDVAAVPDDFPDDEFDDDATFLQRDAADATTAGSSATARRRRLLQTMAFAVTIVVVALLGFFAVMLLRSRSGFQDTPIIETPSSVTTAPPAVPAPATLPSMPPLPSLPLTSAAPAPQTTTPTKTSAPPSSAVTTTPPPTTTPPASTSPPSETHAAPTTTTAPSTPPIDTRPAVGMPCGPQQTGTTTVSNTGIPISCVDTPGGFAWEPPGG